MRWGTVVGRRVIFFFQAEDGIRDLVRSRGLGDVYKRQLPVSPEHGEIKPEIRPGKHHEHDHDDLNRKAVVGLSLIHI